MKKNSFSKILVIRSGAIGDMIMLTPFLSQLRKSYPKAEIALFCGKWASCVLDNNPNVGKVIEFDDGIISGKNIFGLFSHIPKIRKERFDACFVVDKHWVWGLFAKLCGIPKRYGFSRGKEGLFNTGSVLYDGTKNEVDYNLLLLSLAGIKANYTKPVLFPSKKDTESARKFILDVKSKSGKKKIMGIAPGGAINPGQRAFIKRWPAENYIELVCSKGAKESVFILFGHEHDSEVCKRVMEAGKSAGVKMFDATGVSVQQAKAIMENCDVLIMHDSGSLHIASCTNTKLIALFGPTPSKRFAPKNSIVISSKYPPCYDVYGKFRGCNAEIMGSISVEKVLSQTNRFK